MPEDALAPEQRVLRWRLVFASRRRPCPSCAELSNVFEAGGVAVNGYVSRPAALRCPRCGMALARVVVLTGGGDWYWLRET